MVQACAVAVLMTCCATDRSALKTTREKKDTTLKKHTKYIPKMSGKLATELKDVE